MLIRTVLRAPGLAAAACALPPWLLSSTPTTSLHPRLTPTSDSSAVSPAPRPLSTIDGDGAAELGLR